MVLKREKIQIVFRGGYKSAGNNFSQRFHKIDPTNHILIEKDISSKLGEEDYSSNCEIEFWEGF